MPTLDFSADQSVLDNTEAVTFTSVRTAGNQSGTVVNAGFYPQAVSEAAPSYGVYTKGLAKFSVSAGAVASLGGIKPRDTLLVTRLSETYTVLDAQKGPLSGVWQVNAVNLVLAADLRQTAIIKRPPEVKDEGGRLALQSYATVYSAVPCRLQPLESSRTEALGRTTAPRRFICYVGVQVWPILARDVLVVSGQTYTIDALNSPERIDQLPELQCTLID